MKYATLYRVVRYQLKAKLKVPRPRSLKQDPDALDRFKLKIEIMLKGMQRLADPGVRIRYLCQDETRLGLKTLVSRLITACGVKPVGPSQWKRKCFWLFGAVEPLSGFSFFYEFSHLDSVCFEQFLDLLSAELGDDIAVLQVDQASAHIAHDVVWPENIFPTFQPSHAPELNPIERFWLHLKQQLAWKNCPTLDDLRDLLKQTLDNISSETIVSLTSYDFILEALFGAAL